MSFYSGVSDPLKPSDALREHLKSGNFDPRPGPTPAVLNQTLSEILSEAIKQCEREAQAPPEGVAAVPDFEGVLRTCLVMMMTVLLTTNAPATMITLYKFATTATATYHNPNETGASEPVPLRLRTERVAMMKEAGFKCVVLTGVPRVLNVVTAFIDTIEEDVRTQLDLSVPGNPTFAYPDPSSAEQIKERGGNLLDTIYKPHAWTLVKRLGNLHPDFPDWIVSHAYGYVLSNRSYPDDTPPLMGRTLTSVFSVSCLRAEGGVGPQLTSHVFGLLKSAYEPTAQAPHEKWISSQNGVDWLLGAVDRLSALVRGG